MALLDDVAAFEAVAVHDLSIENFADMAFRYDVMELNTAVKPFMFRWLLEQQGYDRAIYLDPDIFVYRPLAEVEALLDGGASAVLTPHILRPLEDGLKPDDHDILKSGVYNLGFAAMTRAPEALDFLAWWGRRLSFQCYSDLPSNLFTDQRWCDFAPSFMPNLALLRHPGYNIAYWNLAQRTVETGEDGHAYVNGEPLVFFHFSGLRFEESKLVSKHQDRLTWADLGGAQRLFADYRQALMDNGWADCRKLTYAYDDVDGIRLTGPIRGLYRKRYPRHAPADGKLDGEFIVRMCNQRVKLPAAPGHVAVTQLMMHLHESRPDLQAAFNLATRDGVLAFLRWFEHTPGKEYGLDPRLTRQALIGTARVEPLVDAARDPVPNEGRGLTYRLWRKFRKRLLGLGVR
ncbi:MAG TPA: hypothetical protein VNS79_10355 [Sphingobium sp.]|nr:hypothetical protein [Sphingobium sp.]